MPSSKTDLSIIILTWNTADITIRCIKTIKKNLTDLKYEIIVVDNNSSDDTLEKLAKEGGIKVIKNKINLGFSQGNNVGAQNAKGRFLFFLNSDMELIDNHLIDVLNYFKQHPEIGLIGPKLLNKDLTDQGSVFPPQTLFNAFKEFWLGEKTFSKYTPDSITPIEIFSITGGALLIDRSFFNQIGGWDKRYFFYYEDLELCRQVRKHQKKIYYFPLCQIVHHHGASGKLLASSDNQWRRLIPSSKIYHGLLKHYLLFLITWSGQKIRHFLVTK